LKKLRKSREFIFSSSVFPGNYTWWQEKSVGEFDLKKLRKSKEFIFSSSVPAWQ